MSSPSEDNVAPEALKLKRCYASPSRLYIGQRTSSTSASVMKKVEHGGRRSPLDRREERLLRKCRYSVTHAAVATVATEILRCVPPIPGASAGGGVMGA